MQQQRFPESVSERGEYSVRYKMPGSVHPALGDIFLQEVAGPDTRVSINATALSRPLVLSSISHHV